MFDLKTKKIKFSYLPLFFCHWPTIDIHRMIYHSPLWNGGPGPDFSFNALRGGWLKVLSALHWFKFKWTQTGHDWQKLTKPPFDVTELMLSLFGKFCVCFDESKFVWRHVAIVVQVHWTCMHACSFCCVKPTCSWCMSSFITKTMLPTGS